MTMKKLSVAIKLELIGMLLLLGSSAWSLFFNDTLAAMSFDSSFYRVEEKLDTIWATLADLYSQSEANTSKAMSRVNFETALANWKQWRQGTEDFRQQKEFGSVVGGITFILGSILIVIGRYLEAPDS